MTDIINDSPSGFTQEDLIKKREEYIEKYCEGRGWNKDSLSISQMHEISTNKQYINPFMVNS